MAIQTKAQLKAEIASSSANNLLGGTILDNIVDSYQDIGTGTVSAVNGIGYPAAPYVTGDILYANSATSMARLADVAAGAVLVSGGVGAPPVWSAIPTLGGLISNGAVGVATSNPGNQVPASLSPGASCIDVQFHGGGGPFSLVLNGPQGTFYAMGSNAGYAWFQNLGVASSGPAWALALNGDTTLNLFYSNNSFTGSPAITYGGITITPGILTAIRTPGSFEGTASNTSLGTYYNGPYLFLQATDPNHTNGNTLVYDFRDFYGHSFAAIIGQVLSQGSSASNGILAFATTNNATAAVVNMVIYNSGGIYMGQSPIDPGAPGALFLSSRAGIGTNALSSAVLALTAGTTAKSQINLAASAAPSAPNDGDFWYDGANVKIRVGASTKTFTLT